MNPSVIGHVEGRDVEEVVLVSDAGVEVAVLTYGALIRDWRVPVAGGLRSVVLGFDTFEPYLTQSPYFGAVCGRLGNRVGDAQFTLDGEVHHLDANEGPNQLHGGPRGFALRVWSIVSVERDSVTLALSSPHGDMGYPGNVEVTLTYRLSGHRLTYEWMATTDTPTPLNIVQHNYFNLMGDGDILDHRLTHIGTAVTLLGKGQIPTGAIEPVAGTALDFAAGRTMRGPDGDGLEIDHNFALPTRRDFADPVATVSAPDGSLTLTLCTDQPGLQVYNGWKIEPDMQGLHGRRYTRFSGLCLEDQNFPDAVNHLHFPDSVVTPERPYHHKCTIEIRP